MQCNIISIICIFRLEKLVDAGASIRDESMEPPSKRCRPKLLDSVRNSPPRKLNMTGKLQVTVVLSEIRHSL